ncbi:MAG: tripartite tricarboxylate transporter substrate binding protein [Pseudomonadota bacterium]
MNSLCTLSRHGAALVALALGLLAPHAHSQQAPWPDKPIRWIVPTAPGGPTDMVARLLGEKVGQALGQPIVIENRAGAGHAIGTEAVARAAPDGYTFGMVTTPHAVNPALVKKLAYDTLKDFEPVSWVTSLPLVLVVNADLPVRSVRDLVEMANARPGTLNMASPGNGTGPHLAGELFRQTTRIKVAHIPYKGGAQATTAVLTGEATFYFDSPASALPHVKAGKLRALAVTSTRRSTAAPDVPTMAEAGYPAVEFNGWNAMIAPAGTPRPIVARMQAEVAKVLAQPGIRERLDAVGFEAVGSSGAEFATLLQKDIAKWAVVVKESGMAVE